METLAIRKSPEARKPPLLRVKPLTKTPEYYLVSIKPYFVRVHGYNKDVPSDAKIKKFIQTEAVYAIEDIITYGPISSPGDAQRMRNSEACDFIYNSTIGTLQFKLPGRLREKQVRDYIVRLLNTPLEDTAYREMPGEGLVVACKSDPKKKCGFIDFRDDIGLRVLYPKRASPKRASPKYNLVQDILNILGYKFTLDSRAEAYFYKLLKKLIPRLNDEEFVTKYLCQLFRPNALLNLKDPNSLMNLGDQAKQDASRSRYTHDKLPGVSGVYESNLLLSICRYLLEDVQYGLKLRRKCVLTAALLEKIIKDDVELSAAFLGTSCE